MSEAQERQDAEISLLSAMYPDQIQWSAQSAEVRFNHGSAASLILRLGSTYPNHGLPELISATSSQRSDLRQYMIKEMKMLNLNEGEEVLDAIIQAYVELLEQQVELQSQDLVSDIQLNPARCKTVIVWLHHLLATSKRKLSLNPSCDSHLVSGATKPGYPGILIFSGEAIAVDTHVANLKQERWQAFQVRYSEQDDADPSKSKWRFEHGSGIREFETMAEIVQDISDETNRLEFLQAVGVK